MGARKLRLENVDLSLVFRDARVRLHFIVDAIGDLWEDRAEINTTGKEF